jgi:putative ATP-binding cassette transporter
MIQLVPVLIVAPLYINGTVEFGAVTQGAMAFAHVLGAFSLIVLEFGRITSFAAVALRLGSIWEALEEPKPAVIKQAIESAEDPERITYEGLTLVTPRDGRLLIEDLSLELPRGRRLLVRGPNGSGRTALLRATAGLWVEGAGRVIRPPRADLVFLPQQPYLVPGSLRDQLLYASPHDEVSDDTIHAVLRRVQFEPIVERVGGLDAEHEWRNVLSRGEQQQLAFARLLLAEPPFAFLDEATSALEPQQGRTLYAVLARTPITYVSVASDLGLFDYHDQLLELRGEGSWRTLGRTNEASA